MGAESPSDGVKAVGLAALDEATVASIAHDINNPLGIILANLDHVLQHPTITTGELGEALRDARSAAERIRAVVGRLGAYRTDVSPVSSVDELRERVHARKARILLIDDEKALAAALRRNLREYDVVITLDAREAFSSLCLGERFDVVLCDLMMPGMTGYELFEALSEAAPEQAARMIFITGGATTEHARKFVERMADRVVHKPCDMRTLRDMIRMHLRE